jgi:hypothetical protein
MNTCRRFVSVASKGVIGKHNSAKRSTMDFNVERTKGHREHRGRRVGFEGCFEALRENHKKD